MRHVININQRFGRLVTISHDGERSHGNIKWVLKCDCGNITQVVTGSLITNKTRSCGCLSAEMSATNNVKHGESRKTTEYKTWAHIKDRCCNPKNRKYSIYGGRGIKVCKRWLGTNGYQLFLLDMGRKPSSVHSIDRKKVNGNYTPKNCKWSTAKEQARNKRNTIYVCIDNTSKTLKEWCEVYGLPYSSVWDRINRGWAIDDRLFKIFKKGYRYKK